MNVPIIGSAPSGPVLTGMFGIFTPAYDAPAVNVVDIFNKANWYDYMANAPCSVQYLLEMQTQDLIDASILATAKLDAAWAANDQFGSLRAAEISISNLEKNNIIVSAITDGTKAFYKLTVSGGIPGLAKYLPGFSQTQDQLMVKRGKSNNAIDKSEQVDFDNRYTSIDASFHDGTDAPNNISFMRIIKATPVVDGEKGIQVFPMAESGWAQPGLTETKFKQFILSSISSVSQERMQVVETSQEFQVLFYGRKPEIITISGIIKNTRTNPWNINMIFLWDSYMRGTVLVEDGNILQLYIDGTLYNGYPFSFQRSQISPTDYLVSFNMSFIVKSKIITNRTTGNYLASDTFAQ